MKGASTKEKAQQRQTPTLNPKTHKMSRLVYIDCLRNVSNMARVLIHASVPYMVSAAPMWPLNEEGSYLFDFAVFETHLFVMEMFYVISGFMFGLEMSRKDVRSIAQNRGQRIVLPFVIGVALFTPIILAMRGFKNHPGYTFLRPEALEASYRQGWELGLENFFPTGHLWFLYYLIFFYGLTLLLRRVLDRIQKVSAVQCLAVGVVLSCVCMSFMDRWIVDNPLTLTIEPPSFVHYFFFFLLGVLMSRQGDLLQNILHRSKAFLRLGIPLGILAIVPQLWSQDSGHANHDLIKTAAIVLGCTSTHLLVMGLWGWFGRRPWKDSPTLRYFTDASYWVYLSNMPLVMLWHVMLAPLDMSIYVKFLISLTGAFGMSMLTYEYAVRYTWVGAMLNKRRVRRQKG